MDDRSSFSSRADQATRRGPRLRRLPCGASGNLPRYVSGPGPRNDVHGSRSPRGRVRRRGRSSGAAARRRARVGRPVRVAARAARPLRRADLRPRQRRGRRAGGVPARLSRPRVLRRSREAWRLALHDRQAHGHRSAAQAPAPPAVREPGRPPRPRDAGARSVRRRRQGRRGRGRSEPAAAARRPGRAAPALPRRAQLRRDRRPLRDEPAWGLRPREAGASPRAPHPGPDSSSSMREISAAASRTS